MGSLSRPWLPSQYSVLVESSAMECLAQNSAPTVRRVFSSATALAPFSQNSAALRFLSDSGHAQPGQSNPPRWFNRSSDCAVRVTPAWATARSNATITALTPAASVLGLWTESSSSLMSATGAGCLPNFIVPTSLPTITCCFLNANASKGAPRFLARLHRHCFPCRLLGDL